MIVALQSILIVWLGGFLIGWYVAALIAVCGGTRLRSDRRAIARLLLLAPVWPVALVAVAWIKVPHAWRWALEEADLPEGWWAR